MTYTDIENSVLAELNRSDVAARVNSWIDQAYRDVMARHNFTWMKGVYDQLTVVSEFKYAVASDFYDTEVVILIDGTNSRELDELLINEYEHKHPNPSSDAYDRPIECSVAHSISGSTPVTELWVWPPSNGVYTLRQRYTITPPVLSGSLVPIIPAKYHSVLVFGGLKYGFARLREYDAAQYWGTEMDRILTAMVKEDRELPNVQRKMGEFKPQRVYGGSDYLSPFVRRMP